MAILDRYSIQLVGKGGQGLQLLGMVLADAMAQAGKNVVVTQKYGAQQRGGTSAANLVISDSEIDFPLVTSPDILLALTQEGFDTYAGKVTRSHTIIIDSGNVQVPDEMQDVHILSVPIEDIAVETTGNKQTMNMVSLGIITKLSGLLPSSRVKEALARRSPTRFLATNIKAFEKGLSLAKSISKQRSRPVTIRPHTGRRYSKEASRR